MKLDCGGLFLLWMGWQVLAFDMVIVIVSILLCVTYYFYSLYKKKDERKRTEST